MRRRQPIKKKRGLIFVLSGPSGSGKTTLAERLLKHKRLKKNFVKSVSLTTRPKRSGEKQGAHYFFIPESIFRKKLAANKILEWTRYLGYYYATPRGPVEKNIDAGKNMVLCLDLKGARKVRKLYPKNTVTIFVKPPSLEELNKRIKLRCSKITAEEVRQRLMRAKQEISAARWYDYRILNKRLAEAERALEKIILKETAH